MIKKIIPVFFISLFTIFLILGYTFKDKMNSYLSGKMKENISTDIVNATEASIDSLYNYEKNYSSFRITFLEFGSKGCVSCKRMEKVMEEIEALFPDEVNVVFHNVMLPENKKLMKFYGIVAIPSQILLNRSGKEVFRHTGYISTEKLSGEINKYRNEISIKTQFIQTSNLKYGYSM